ncbi:MAG: nucleotidyltransferase substrate binding protein [Ghiorsea sp.]|nr:nucleotidyltransferase substrate binding protein [Ghiorsea sp.]
MIEDIRWQQRFDNFCRALNQLTKFIQKGDLNELEEQGLIQAFEYNHELAWKTLKDFLESKGTTNLFGSKDVSREAFKLGLLGDSEQEGMMWLDMIEKRNLTSHTYNEETAQEIVRAIKQSYFDAFVALRERLQGLIIHD